MPVLWEAILKQSGYLEVGLVRMDGSCWIVSRNDVCYRLDQNAVWERDYHYYAHESDLESAESWNVVYRTKEKVKEPD